MESRDGSGNGDTKRRPGRPRKLSPAQVDRLRELALQNPLLPMAEFLDLFESSEGVRLGSASMRKYLASVGIERTRGGRTAPAEPDGVVVEGPAVLRYSKKHRDEGEADRYPHGLTDAEWELVSDLFENNGAGRPPKYARRKILDACCYVIRSGAPWRMLPRDLPPWQTVYAHFRRWTKAERFEQMHDRLRAMWRERENRSPNPTAGVVDAQSVATAGQGAARGSTPARR